MFKEKEKDDVGEKAEKARKHVADDARTGAYRVVNDVYDTGSTVLDDVQDLARSTGKKFRKFKDQAEDASDQMKTQIRDNPFVSTGIAVVAGFLIGSLFRR